MTEVRGTAERRRRQAVDVGLAAFADHGPTTSAVQRVADRMGVSQPYVFRLFGSKQGFFLACLDELERLVVDTLSQPTKAARGDQLDELGAGFRALLSDGVLGGLWLQACAIARADEVVADRCRTLIARALHATQQNTGVGDDELAAFLGRGALVAILQAIGVDLGGGSRAAVAELRMSGGGR